MKHRGAPRRRRLWVRVLLGAALAVVIVSAAAYFALGRLVAQPPDWWQPPAAADPQILETARAVENGMTTLLHQRHDPGVPWTMRLSEADANAWLAARLREWAVNHSADFTWPSDVSAALLDLHPGAMTIGVAVSVPGTGEAPKVVSATVMPRVDEAGVLWTPASSFHVGRLMVPGSIALGAAESPLRRAPAGSASADKLAAVLAGRAPLSREPVLRLSDGRRVRVTAIRIETDQLLVTCRELIGDR